MNFYTFSNGDEEELTLVERYIGEFISPKVGSAYFREKYWDQFKKAIHDVTITKKVTTEDGTTKEEQKVISKKRYEIMCKRHSFLQDGFSELNFPKRQLLITLIYDLLSESKKNAMLKVYLDAFINEYYPDENLTYHKLAKYIYSYLSHSSDSEDFYVDFENIKSKLQKLTNTNNPSKDNEILDLVAGYFSVDIQMLLTGSGFKYRINFEELEKVMKSMNMEVDEFLEEIIDKAYYNELGADSMNEAEKQDFRIYVLHNAQLFAELVDCAFGSATTNLTKKLLIEEPYWIEPDNFPIQKHFDNLSESNKAIVKNVLFYLCIN